MRASGTSYDWCGHYCAVVALLPFSQGPSCKARQQMQRTKASLTFFCFLVSSRGHAPHVIHMQTLCQTYAPLSCLALLVSPRLPHPAPAGDAGFVSHVCFWRSSLPFTQLQKQLERALYGSDGRRDGVGSAAHVDGRKGQGGRRACRHGHAAGQHHQRRGEKN